MIRTCVGGLGFGLPAACVTVITLPVTRIEPERAAVVVFSAIVYVKDPLPVPDPLAVIQPVIDAADHAQPVVVVTVIVPVVAIAGGVRLDGVTV